jgi:S-DNA-T family DNA segregation ATPase FtsK/SpoIIIE
VAALDPLRAAHARLAARLRACRPDRDPRITVAVNPFCRTAVRPKPRPRRDQLPRIVNVRSGGSWDEVHVKLVAGQTPEDFDQAARALAVARGVARCQVRELGPNLVSVDYQRRDLLAEPVLCVDLAALAKVRGEEVDLRRVWSGRTEYGTDWHQPLAGGTP